MILVVVILRLTTGEERIAGFGPLEGALFLANPLLGPLTSMAMFVYRPIETLMGLNASAIVPMSMTFIAIALVLLGIRVDGQEEKIKLVPQKSLHSTCIGEPFTTSIRLSLVGVLMLILAYPLTLTTLGFAVSGRGTRAHMAAVVGSSILFACISSTVIRRAAARGRKRIATLALSAWLALMVGFGLKVQHDYTLARNFQRLFWTDVVRLCPDLADGTVIFVDPTGLPDNRQFLFLRGQLEGVPDTRQIKFLEPVHFALQNIYRFPSVWKYPPIVYRMPMDWRELIQFDNSMPMIDEAVAREVRQSQQKVESTNAILLETSNGYLNRQSGPTLIAGHKVTLKTPSVLLSPVFSRGPLYKYLIGDIGAGPSEYLYSRGMTSVPVAVR
jgi:hypothetical protein